jgi:hypothetical protein
VPMTRPRQTGLDRLQRHQDRGRQPWLLTFLSVDSHAGSFSHLSGQKCTIELIDAECNQRCSDDCGETTPSVL